MRGGDGNSELKYIIRVDVIAGIVAAHIKENIKHGIQAMTFVPIFFAYCPVFFYQFAYCSMFGDIIFENFPDNTNQESQCVSIAYKITENKEIDKVYDGVEIDGGAFH